MGKLSIALYLVVILLLASLAALPHWPTLKQEAAHIYATWQQLRNSGEHTKNTATQDRSPEKENSRGRAIAPPKPVAELPTLTENNKTSEALDPFIREARARAQEDPEAAMQWLQVQSTGEERLRGMLEVVALWAAKDSEAALLWLESNAQGIARLETLNSGIAMWADRDPEAAAGWIDGMANDQSKISAAKSLASTWVRTNPAAASEWLGTLPNGPVRAEAASALALSWMDTDPASAGQWANQEANSTGNHQILSQAIEKYTQLAPQEAEAFVRNLSWEDPFDFLIYTNSYVKARANNDPAGTAEWLQSLSKDDRLNNTDHATSLMQVWTETDSIAASAWLSEQPLGPERDAAIAGFAESIKNFEPSAAVTWANTISNPAQRMEQLTNSIRNWAKSDPEDALKWVIKAELEPALQERLAREIAIE